jgi:DNA-directed RNA polymerase I, II, and III subunit RPABC2
MADDEHDAVGFGEEGAEVAVPDIFGESDASNGDPLFALKKHHPECSLEYADTIAPKLPLTSSPSMSKDPNHRSPPFLTQYERTKIIGMRANQLSQGARPYIQVPEYVTSVGEIARLELHARRLPFIIRRAMPDGTHEYWRLSDLLIL